MEVVRTVLGKEVIIIVVAIEMLKQVVAGEYKVQRFTSGVVLSVWHQGVSVRSTLLSSLFSSF